MQVEKIEDPNTVRVEFKRSEVGQLHKMAEVVDGPFNDQPDHWLLTIRYIGDRVEAERAMEFLQQLGLGVASA